MIDVFQMNFAFKIILKTFIVLSNWWKRWIFAICKWLAYKYPIKVIKLNKNIWIMPIFFRINFYNKEVKDLKEYLNKKRLNIKYKVKIFLEQRSKRGNSKMDG